MQLTITSPTTVEIPDDLKIIDILSKSLKYKNKRAEYDHRRLKNNNWMLARVGPERFADMLEELKVQINQTLLNSEPTPNGTRHWTFAGLAKSLAEQARLPLVNLVEYPEFDNIPWANPPKKSMRPYQKEAMEALLEAKHGAVEIGTGLGKSFLLLNLAKTIGLKTVVMTPSVSIAEQIHSEFTEAFGKRYVGAFFGGKKDSKKLFTVAVGASLALVNEASEHWDNLRKVKVFIADESHLCPAQTLQQVCHRLLENAPYRFFFSGTQMRNDGLDLVLDSITGPIVYTMTVAEGVEQGYLARPRFHVIRTTTSSTYSSDDANEMTRQHLFYNPIVNRTAARIANTAVEKMGHSVLILVDEVEQFAHLLPHLNFKCGFAHGGVTKQNASKVPQNYHKSDPNALVEQFNNKELPILIGTSCISTGTDVRAVQTIIYLMGGKSEIQVKQAVGRGTRLYEGKTDCHIFDFDVINNDTTTRHASERVRIYRSILDDVEEVDTPHTKGMQNV
jgi:superfamily II DNA or RNA helicase